MRRLGRYIALAALTCALGCFNLAPNHFALATGACVKNCGTTGVSCVSGDDCQSTVCQDSTCAAPSCGDKLQNGSETDVDCGGPCPPCAIGQQCSVNADCVDDLCTSGTCAIVVAAQCSDGLKNGDETGTDCGGSCKACASGQPCSVAADCQTQLCVSGTCTAPGCSNLSKDANETDVDCGGSCPPCAAGLACAIQQDCDSSVCTGSVCQAASCFDGVLNQNESSADCGGSCKPCTATKNCNQASDCWNSDCVGNKCSQACPSDMVSISPGNFCIDKTEVRYLDYTNWLATSPDPTHGQIAQCASWNTTFAINPSSTCPAANSASNPQWPVSCVNWCDAVYYCTAHGRHICRNLNGNNVGYNMTAENDPSKDQWFAACSSNGTRAFAYGNTGHDGYCRAATGNGTPWNVGSGTSCAVGPSGPFDMDGNVTEWEDSCSTPASAGAAAATDMCASRGGYYNNTYDKTNCAVAADQRPRNYYSPGVGFRCCALD